MKNNIRHKTSLKTKKNWFRLLEPFIIITFWLLVFAAPILFTPYEDEYNWTHTLGVWDMLYPFAILYLLHHFILLPYLFFRNKRVIYLISTLLIILLMGFGHNKLFNKNPIMAKREIIREHPHPQGPPPHEFRDGPRANDGPKGPNARRQGPPPQTLPPYLNFLIIALLVIGFDIGLTLAFRWVESEQQRIQAQKENIQSQLDMLQAQVNPHFFMNTLNNIHALIEYDTEGAKDSVIRLSKLMRYLLYDTQAGSVALIKEAEFIRNYVELMRIRFSHSVSINLALDQSYPDVQIPPLLFTSFLENAFKHGISYKNKSSIHIRLACTEKEVRFEIENTNHAKKTSEPGGIGIANSQKRLNILYQDNYTLEIKDSKTVYNVKLNIPI